MKLEVAIDGRAAKLEVDAGKFRYQREDGEAIEREFSIAPLAPGSFSVLIGERSYEVVGGRRRNPGEWTGVSGGGVRSARHAGPQARRGRRGTHGNRRDDAGESGARPGRGKATKSKPAQGLVVVEAMKMQNEMKSPKAGRVVEVKIKRRSDGRGGRSPDGDRVALWRTRIAPSATEPAGRSSSATALSGAEKCACACVAAVTSSRENANIPPNYEARDARQFRVAATIIRRRERHSAAHAAPGEGIRARISGGESAGTAADR